MVGFDYRIACRRHVEVGIVRFDYGKPCTRHVEVGIVCFDYGKACRRHVDVLRDYHKVCIRLVEV